MRRNTKIFSLSIGAVLVLIVLLVRAMAYRDFHMSGVIVDESGAAIQDVTIDVVTSRRIKMGTDSDTASRYIKANGTFDLDLDNYSSVYLHFIKKGFKVKTLGFTEGGSHKNLRVVMRTATTQPGNAKGGWVPNTHPAGQF